MIFPARAVHTELVCVCCFLFSMLSQVSALIFQSVPWNAVAHSVYDRRCAWVLVAKEIEKFMQL
jgi:hypothetical protein